MYDTAAVLLGPFGKTFPQLPAWDRAIKKRTENPAKDHPQERWILNEPGGIQLTLLDRATLMVERSLPKALRGSNVVEFTQDDVPEAIAAVDREVGRILEFPELPSIGEGQPCRVDYSENRRIGPEEHVRPLFNHLRLVELPRRGRPVLGDSGVSISWPRGSFPLKVYGKFEESGDPAAMGVVRLEQGIRHRRTFLQLLRRDKEERVTLSEVLHPRLRERVLSDAVSLLGRVMMSERELSDREFVDEMVKMFGGPRCYQLLGFCVAYQLAGMPTMKQISEGRHVFGFTRPAVYRYLADLRALRGALVERELKFGHTVPQLWLADSMHRASEGEVPAAAEAAQQSKRGRPLKVGEITSADRALIDYIASFKRYAA
jgi:hypothetical protein